MNAICRPQTQVRAPRAGEAGRTPAGRSEGRSGAARGHRAAERTSDSAWHRGLALTAAPSSPHARQQSRAAGLASEAPPPPRPAAVATLKQRGAGTQPESRAAAPAARESALGATPRTVQDARPGNRTESTREKRHFRGTRRYHRGQKQVK